MADGNRFFAEFQQLDSIRVPQNVGYFFFFLMQFGLRRAAPFRIVSDTLVYAAATWADNFTPATVGLGPIRLQRD